MSYELIAISIFLSMMVMLLTGQRVFGAIGGVACIFAILLWGTGGEGIAFHASFILLNWYPLLTLPLFIYMGYMFSESGIADDLYHMFHVWMGPLRGGLALGTIGVMTAVAAMNGLSVAGMAIGCSLALPEMLKRKYDKIMISGVIQAGSSLGIMIPPSVVLVLYGMIARQNVGRLWMAGVFPGLLLSFMMVVYVVVRCWLQPELGPALSAEERQMPWKEKFRLLRAGVLPLFIIFSMTGLFLGGVTSLVECSATGAAVTTVAAILKGRMNKRVLVETVRNTMSVSCMFMWVIMAALAFSAVFDGLGAVHAIEILFLEKWHLSRWGIMIMMQITYLIMGTFLDDTAMLVIVAPLYIPLVIKMGFDPIWYGVLYTITCQIAYMTPPFGYNLFLMRAMAPKDYTLADIYRSIVPFVLLFTVGLAIVMIFPEIALWLPNWYFGK